MLITEYRLEWKDKQNRKDAGNYQICHIEPFSEFKGKLLAKLDEVAAELGHKDLHIQYSVTSEMLSPFGISLSTGQIF